MIRDSAIKEMQARLYNITEANGYPFDVKFVARNPQEDPKPEQMPTAHIFETTDRIIKKGTRGAATPPSYVRSLIFIVEYWYNSATEGDTTPDIIKFLKASRKILFEDGNTLGGLAISCDESETSRIYRPRAGQRVVGIGCTYELIYVEDFAKITF